MAKEKNFSNLNGWKMKKALRPSDVQKACQCFDSSRKHEQQSVQLVKELQKVCNNTNLSSDEKLEELKEGLSLLSEEISVMEFYLTEVLCIVGKR